MYKFWGCIVSVLSGVNRCLLISPHGRSQNREKATTHADWSAAGGRQAAVLHTQWDQGGKLTNSHETYTEGWATSFLPQAQGREPESWDTPHS